MNPEELYKKAFEYMAEGVKLMTDADDVDFSDPDVSEMEYAKALAWGEKMSAFIEEVGRERGLDVSGFLAEMEEIRDETKRELGWA